MMKNNSPGNREPRQEEEFSESSYEYSEESAADEPAAAVPANSQPRAAAAQDLDQPVENAADDDEGNENKNKTRGVKKWARKIPNPAAKVQSIAVALSGPDSQRITLYLFLLIGLLHFLFVILSSVLSQIDQVGGGCFTYWGYKANCDATSYTLRASLIKDCPRLRSMLQAGAAFSIFSILTSLSVVTMGWILCSRMRHVIRLNRRRARYGRHAEKDQLLEEPADASAGGKKGKKAAKGTQFQPGLLKWATVGVVCGSLVCELICWAIIAGLQTTPQCDLMRPDETTYGVGFGLGLTAWLVELIVLPCLIVLV